MALYVKANEMEKDAIKIDIKVRDLTCILPDIRICVIFGKDLFVLNKPFFSSEIYHY